MNPEERVDDNHRARHAHILALPHPAQYELVLLGDSLTRRWEDYPEQWNRHFGNFKAANLGVGGDTIENVLWRIGHSELDGLHPAVLVLLIGTNNLPRDSAHTVAAGLTQLTTQLGVQLPRTKILVVGPLPRNPEPGRDFGALVAEVNRLASALDNGKSVFFRDYGWVFPRVGGLVDPALMPDGLHLNAAGYDLWGPVLAATVRDLSSPAPER